MALLLCLKKYISECRLLALKILWFVFFELLRPHHLYLIDHTIYILLRRGHTMYILYSRGQTIYILYPRGHAIYILYPRGHAMYILYPRGHTIYILYPRGHTIYILYPRGHTMYILYPRGHNMYILYPRGHNMYILYPRDHTININELTYVSLKCSLNINEERSMFLVMKLTIIFFNVKRETRSRVCLCESMHTVIVAFSNKR